MDEGREPTFDERDRDAIIRAQMIESHKFNITAAINGFDSVDEFLADYNRLKRMEIMWGTAGPNAPTKGILDHG